MSLALRLSHLVLSAVILTLVSGCTQLDLNKKTPWSSGFEDEPGVPEKVVARCSISLTALEPGASAGE